MKIWIKILLGTSLGAALGYFLRDIPQAQETMDFISFLVIRTGGYVFYPLIFFATALGVHELKQERRFASAYAGLIGASLLATVGLVLIGAGSVSLFAPARLPIFYESEHPFVVPTVQSIALRVFPDNAFQVFIEGDGVVLPLFVFAMIVGLNLGFHRVTAAPTVQLFESLNRILYRICSLYVEVLGLGMLVIAATRFHELQELDIVVFKQLLILLSVDLLLVVIVIYPVLLYLLGGRMNPLKWLYGSLASMLTAVVSANVFVSLNVLIKHGKESLGIRRAVSSSAYPLFAILGRSGTALLACTSFILVMKSYSSLEIPWSQMGLIVGSAMLVSFAVGSIPGFGVLVAVSLLCSQFDLQEGYLILIPVAPVLASVGVVLDIATCSFIAALVAKRQQMAEDIAVKEFV